MILKKLILHGFKSFADKTEFDFEPGITGIVGPNGCGKSNVVDAIKWALGSQSAKSLRGTQMLDVVFNGSGTRKPSGMSQVDLVFDNADRRLPLDAGEVTVSRRLFRSGESEYLINKQVVRLKDVRDLFLDTGIGVEAYSVIEQGRVDSLLRANPLDRRLIFEEAAGISKYKARKREAQRRLERVNQNLLRLQDIVEELERRLRSIKVQAGKARSYQQYSQRLRELRSVASLAEYHRLIESQQGLDRRAAELSDSVTQMRTRESEHEARASQANVAVLELEQQITTVDGQLLTAQSRLTALEERISGARLRIDEQIGFQDRGRVRAGDLEQQLSAARRELDAHEEQRTQRLAELAAAEQAVAGQQSADQRAADELARLTAELDAEKSGILELVRRASQLSGEITRLELQREHLASDRSRVEQRGEQITRELADLMGRQRAFDERLVEIDRLTAEQSERLAATRQQRESLATRRAALADQLAASKEHRSARQSRREVLAELDRRRDGLHQAVRDILARRDAQSGAFAYVLGPLGELFEADSDHAPVVEAALGEFEQMLVVSQRDAFLADQAAIEATQGRVAAFCLDCLGPAIAGPDLRDQPGVVAALIDWVRFPAECERLARFLLGRAYVVDDVATARRLLSTLAPTTRFVTRDGVVCEPDGRVAIGARGAGTGTISRRSELRDLVGELAAADEQIDRLTAELSAVDAEAAQTVVRQRELEQAISDAKARRAEAAAHAQALAADVQRLSAEQPGLAREAAELAQQAREAEICQQSSRETMNELQANNAQRERTVAELTARIEQAAGARSRAAERRPQRASARASWGSSARLAEARKQALSAIAAQAAQLEAVTSDVEAARERVEELQRQISDDTQALADLRAQTAALAAEAARLREQRDERRREIDEHGAALRALRTSLADVEAALHAEQMRLSEVRVHLESLVARVREEMSVDLAEQYARYAPGETDAAAIEAEIAELRGKIERLGNVNLDAIGEQEELEQRHGFLTRQRDDLRESEKQLLELIETLNRESVDRFAKTFAEVREHFAALFKKLFGGGKADVFLENPADVLESGIEIVARPPGKELQSMTLLSGGEKTMTAIALLLAVFKTHPSPFAILDEVDAALDEANNLRFNHVIQEFTSGTQFLIITHSKRTMSIADVLYGVTMQEAGVSKRISVRFDREQPAERHAVA
ncbi:MAG: chromosome segregation protein SMC [Phycisphaerae bacterium]